MPSEAKFFFGSEGWEKIYDFKGVSGKYLFSDKSFFCVVAGTGRCNSARAASYLISKGASLLISTGVAGGLDPLLEPGTIIVSNRVVEVLNEKNFDGFKIENRFKSSPFRNSLMFQYNGYVNGTVLTVSKPLCLSREKEKARNITKAVTVDMESAGVADEAIRRDIPFYSVRAVCDPAYMDIPENIMNCIDSEGNVSFTRLARFLILNPFIIYRLIQMKRDFHSACLALRNFWDSELENKKLGVSFC